MSIITEFRPAAKVDVPKAAVVFSSIGSTDRACFALRRCMWNLGYNQAVTGEALALARRDGDLEAAISEGCIEPEDVPACYEAFERGFDFVAPESLSWDEVDDHWTADDVPPLETSTIVDKPALPTGPRMPVDDFKAFAEMDGRFDVRSKPTAHDEASFRFWQEWAKEAYVEPYRYIQELDDIRVAVPCY